ncbi:23S rRNA (guanosine(2251)-2'-O)-methyltransferase RlmB [Mesomycoplasma neurolyticum]|uniref:rRNA methylase n=1 Tax=Mesomycoplasma neurolyticum TaxID=2120 RepID=A0A449A6C9_9BACT|nr:23S rRNA (guanosine(2251)-2'-O)-methyltransferase RlmB [Mesomycoplasma neurolyticum]VEU59794.1 rRNA methylase [Mesomycoplasma neurolyticum]
MKKFICGKNSVIDSLKNNLPISLVYTTNHKLHLEFPNFKIKLVTNEFLNQLTTENHQGYVAQILDIKFYDLNTIIKDKAKEVIILDHIQDPHNFGAIIRTANANGIKHIIFPKDRSVDVTPTVLKVSSGGFVNMKFIKVTSIVSTILKLKKNNYWVYGTSLTKKSKNINDVLFNKPLAIIFGSEGNGLTKAVERVCDELVYIPMKGTVQSLNISVAVGIVLFKIN